MNDNGKMSGASWIVLECLIALVVFGAFSFFVKPAYEFGVGLIIGALISTLNNAAGVKSGSSMPEQPGDPKPGQTSQSETNTKIETAPPPPTA